MAIKPRILVVGSANIDFIANTERVPAAGETLLSRGNYEFVPGGKGANCAVAAARLGADVVFCTRVGNDTYGKMLSKVYSDEKIDCRSVIVDKKLPTGLAAIHVEASGANRITVFPGANSAVSRADVEDAFMSYPDALLTQFEIPLDTVYYAIKQANENDTPVIVDGGPVPAELDFSALGKLTVFSPNESEAYAYTGIRPVDADSYIRICLDLYSRINVDYIVLKLGEKGCYVYDGHFGEAVPSYRVTAVDTTAAGDSFTAALTYEFLRSGNIRSACRYANAVGGLAVTKCGALPSLPTEKEVLEFIKQNS